MEQGKKTQCKRLAGILLALVMVLALAIPASAAETVVNNTTSHTYDIYQIFSGTQADDGQALGDVAWGSGINGDAFLAALKADSRFGAVDANIFKDCTEALAVAKVLSGYNNDSDVAKAFANVAAANLTGVKVALSGTGSIELATGYYLVVDTTDVSGANDARNTALLQVTHVGNFTIAQKYSVPTLDKKVVDSDGTAGEAADYAIGSSIPFTLTATLPTNYADYEDYDIKFTDTLSAGLTYNGDAKVYVVNDATETALNASDYSAALSGSDLVVTVENIHLISGITATSKIKVAYSATLNTSATIGNAGNTNSAVLEFSNDPNATAGGSMGKTPADDVKVFTYELDVTKVDGADTTKKLSGAEFKLKNAAGKWAKVNDNSKLTGWADTEEAGSVLTSDSNGVLKFIGLDAGTYYLKETKAPIGYNLLKGETTLVIAATVNKTDGAEALTALTIKVGDNNAENGVLNTGIVSVEVKNNSGSVLPETGGMGTTLFYVLGGLLVTASAVLLITKKRMSAEV